MSEEHERASQHMGRTGPKTAAGKRRSAGNARKHGLAAKKPEDQMGRERIRQLAAALAGKLSSPSSAEDLIQQAAESQYAIEQVRMFKAEALAKALFDGADSPGEGSGAPLPMVSVDWQRLERYERRAFKRRQQAFLEIIALASAGSAKRFVFEGQTEPDG
jgi:hypothetical protein